MPRGSICISLGIFSPSNERDRSSTLSFLFTLFLPLLLPFIYLRSSISVLLPSSFRFPSSSPSVFYLRVYLYLPALLPARPRSSRYPQRDAFRSDKGEARRSTRRPRAGFSLFIRTPSARPWNRPNGAASRRSVAATTPVERYYTLRGYRPKGGGQPGNSAGEAPITKARFFEPDASTHAHGLRDAR